MANLAAHLLVYIADRRVYLMCEEGRKWTLPGGRAEGNEITECVKREVKEKLGGNCTLEKSFAKRESVDPSTGEPIIIYAHFGAIEGKLTPQEGIRVAFFSLSEARQLPLDPVTDLFLCDLEEKHLL